jgi:hypothetical protein
MNVKLYFTSSGTNMYSFFPFKQASKSAARALCTIIEASAIGVRGLKMATEKKFEVSVLS